ncbi:aminopeptidase P family protein [Rhizobium sp. CFBP 8762]|uniref:M24 family metallopeptidase n=1 Tax=Rhizobium sp. CFBP 8762 TaxID=2775279 RepID=UPI00177DC5D4|nr:Xaa-Pro peptidase family protein [Rhizobium sp. CFBP 8762]MBD8554376.1 aminopeptidase P family protein [Rhizobium sp. CFBP 8762]
MDERLAKTIAAIKASGADWGLFTSPDGVAYACGHIVPIETGPSPFAGGPAVAIVGVNGECGLVITNLEAGTESWANPIVTYEGFSFREPTDIAANYIRSVNDLLVRFNVGGTLALEPQSFPLSLADSIAAFKQVSVTAAFQQVRAIKTTREVELLREAALTASAGQQAFVNAARAGRTELDIFADIRIAMETRAGGRVPLTGDFISGKEKTSAFMGWPDTRILQTGDPVICDLAPRVGGYWGDSCASAMVGEATDGYRNLFSAAKSALELAVETVRPGLIVGDLDQALEAHIARHGYTTAHHSGHSIGTGVHEWPRLVAYERKALEAGMVIMVEPTAFDPDVGGVRLEWMLHVTPTGCDILTNFEHHCTIS